MIERQEAEAQRIRLERAARELEPGDKLWFEVHSTRRAPCRRRWKAAVARPEEVRSVLAGSSTDGALFELDAPAQLPEMLDALGVRPVQRVPQGWDHLVFFGCDVQWRHSGAV